MVSSASEAAFNENMRKFKEHDERAVSYALKVWINPDGFKAKVVRYLVD